MRRKYGKVMMPSSCCQKLEWKENRTSYHTKRDLSILPHSTTLQIKHTTYQYPQNMKKCYSLVLFALWSANTSAIADIDNALDFTDAFDNLIESDAYDQHCLNHLKSPPSHSTLTSFVRRACHCDAIVPNANEADAVSSFLCDHRDTTHLRASKHYEHFYLRSLQTTLICFIVCISLRSFANKNRFLLLFSLYFARTSAFIASGSTHNCAVISDGTKCWGHGLYGRLGYGDGFARGMQASEMGNNLPIVELGSNFVPSEVTAGGEHTCALSSLNTVKCFGKNGDGQLGLGDSANRGDDSNQMGNYLLEVDLGTGFTSTQIVAGRSHTCALSDGTPNKVKCFGANWEGQSGWESYDIYGDSGSDMGDGLPFVDLGSNFEPMQIATGKRHTCALSTTNTVKCFGENNYGQLGYEDTDRRGDDSNQMGNHLPEANLGSGFIPMQIVTGAYYTCVLSTLDKVKCWGANEDGQLGRGVYDPEAKGNEENEMGDYLLEIDLGSFTHPPTSAPTEPTRTPTSGPSGHPSSAPTLYPTTVPTAGPTVPTRIPTTAPTKDPSKNPTYVPTVHPTIAPTTNPSKYPTNAPIPPSQIPTDTPTLLPTTAPTTDPSKYPTDAPTAPSQYPSDTPTVHPTITPTKDPSKYPT
eukprot:922038_1